MGHAAAFALNSVLLASQRLHQPWTVLHTSTHIKQDARDAISFVVKVLNRAHPVIYPILACCKLCYKRWWTNSMIVKKLVKRKVCICAIENPKCSIYIFVTMEICAWRSYYLIRMYALVTAIFINSQSRYRVTQKDAYPYFVR